MAKGHVGKLGKLKCLIKKWQGSPSSAKLTNVATSDHGHDQPTRQKQQQPMSADHKAVVPLGLHPVYVGKSLRRYLISSHLVDHPLFRILVQRSGGGSATGSSTVVVGCEVVLFEHLLWMLENADPQPESLEELVDFYAC